MKRITPTNRGTDAPVGQAEATAFANKLRGQAMSTHVNNHDGEEVTVVGHVNGITIYDSEDEQGQELLDEVFAELFSPIGEQ